MARKSVYVMIILTLASKLFAHVNKRSARVLGSFSRNFCEERDIMMCDKNETEILEKTRRLAPPLSNDRHKGQAGRIGVFGGSIEYTGAPYFASISSLKVGADLVYVFCNKDAAPVIKTYSPELIVLPFLDDPLAMEKIEPWLERLHVILIGPGLGRDTSTFQVIERVISSCKSKNKPLVVDADGLFLVAGKPSLIDNYTAPIILTPNVMEFRRLVQHMSGDLSKQELASEFIGFRRSNITILCKDHVDEIISKESILKVSGGGSGRRCGGQGDLLAGSLSTFFAWAVMNNIDVSAACYAASRLTRECNARASAKYGRSMTTSDMINEIGSVFKDHFELPQTLSTL